nr:putative wax ester synthase/acyl-CoA:diacylglycerol acyltransferase [uncultured bacterium]
MRQLNGIDSQFLSWETDETPEHVGALSIYDQSTAKNGKLRFKDILRLFETRLGRSRLFTDKLVRVPFDLDKAYWTEDPNFDLEYHVRHIALPKPGDWRQLCIQVSRLHAQHLDLKKPLWVAYVIGGLDGIKGIPKGSFAVYLKMHHAAVDGMAGHEVLAAIHDLQPTHPAGRYGTDLKKRDKVYPPTKTEMYGRAYWALIKRPFVLANAANKAGPALLKSRSTRKQLKQLRAESKPHTRFDTPVSPYRVFSAMEFPLAEIQAIRKAVPGATINDVALTIVSQAVRAYLKDHNELPDKTLRSIIPVSLRRSKEAGKGGNQITSIDIPAFTTIADPVLCLTAIQGSTKEAKAFRRQAGDDAIVELMTNMPPDIQKLSTKLFSISAGLGRSAVPANYAVSNVPGPPVPLYLAGAKCVKAYGVGILQHGCGLFHIVGSYNRSFTLSFTACREQMPDPGKYHRCLEAAFADLSEAAKTAIAAKENGVVNLAARRKS